MQSNLETSTTGDQGTESSEENTLPRHWNVPTVLYSVYEQEKGKIWHPHIH